MLRIVLGTEDSVGNNIEVVDHNKETKTFKAYFNCSRYHEIYTGVIGSGQGAGNYSRTEEVTLQQRLDH